MKYRSILLLVLVITLLSGCDKEISENERKSEVFVGETKNMIVNNYNVQLFGSYHEPEILNIDLDNNGIADIQFESVMQGSPQMGAIPVSFIRALHDNIGIIGYYTHDTLFINQTTIIYDDVFPVEVETTVIISCNMIDESDSTFIRSVLRMQSFEPLETIGINDSYLSKKFTIYNSGFGHGFFDEIGDTIFYFYESIAGTCYDYPRNKPIYLGVKHFDESKLGWVKFKTSGRYFFIYQSAIQK